MIRGAKKNHQIFSMIPSELYSDKEVTPVCLAILGYALVNVGRVVGRTEIINRFKVGKQTYYDSIDILQRKGYCVKVDSVNYQKGTFGFSLAGHIFYKYPIGSLKWMEEYGTERDNEIANKILFWQLENTNLSDEQVGLIKDTIVGSMKDTCGSNEGHYSGSNEGHIINSKEKTNSKEKNTKKEFLQNSVFDSFESIAKSDTDACTNNKHDNERVTLSKGGDQLEDVRKKNTLASAPYARIGITQEHHDELKQIFEQFRVAYRKANGSVGGLDKEFEHIKKKHPKTWHEVIPMLLDKLNDQNNQRKAQLEEVKFTPPLPMLSRYVNEQMWDRHYYTSTRHVEPKKTIPNFTPEQLL